MGAMTGVAIGPMPAGLFAMGQALAPLRTAAGLTNLFVPFRANMSASYATGGDTFAMPTPSELSGYETIGIIIAPMKIGARWYTWDGSQTAPKIQAWTAFNTEETATTNLSAVVISGFVFGAR